SESKHQPTHQRRFTQTPHPTSNSYGHKPMQALEGSYDNNYHPTQSTSKNKVYRLLSSTSSPNTQGLRGSTMAATLSSPRRAPIVTQTCFVAAAAEPPGISRAPVHRSLPSRLRSLF